MKKFLIPIYLIFAVIQAWAVDTYNPANGQLTIPTVVVGDKLYTNVVVAISGVVAVNGGAVNSYWDTYDTSNGQLTIPAVTVGSITYNNVVASVGSVVSIGGVVNANPTLSDAGTWTPVTDPSVLSSSYTGLIANTFHSLIKMNNSYGLVTTGWSMSGGPSTLPIPAKVSIGLFDSDSKGNLHLNTSKYINDPITNGGGSVIIYDFNSDGVEDIFLAAHNESPFIQLPSAAYISNARGGFDKITTSESVMAHDAKLSFVNGKPIINFRDIYQYSKLQGSIYTYQNGTFLLSSGKGPIGISGMSSAISFSGSSIGYQYVDSDFIEGYNKDGTMTGSNIKIYKFDPNTLDFDPNKSIQTIVPLLSTLPQYKNFVADIGGPGITHVPRIWAHDLNNDGFDDLIAADSLWTQSQSYPTILQILQNKGDGTYSEKTSKLNPDMSYDNEEHDYTPSFIDLDNSGIKTLFFSGTFSNISRQPNFVLLNDGTGRLYIALHDQFLYFTKLIADFTNTYWWNRINVPKFLAIPQNDGSINFLAEIMTYTSYTIVESFPYVNVPLHYNPKTDFTQNITVSDRNNSMLMRTWAGNDVFYDTNANTKPTKIDGGLGTNKVIYSGSSAQYSVSRNTNGTATVISLSSAPIQVNDTLTNIHQIQFTDKTISLN